MACGFSSFAITSARPKVSFLTSATSSGRRTKETATQSMPASSPALRSARSFPVIDETGISVSGRLTPLRFVISPPDIDDGNGVRGAGLDDMKPHLAIVDEDGLAWLQGAQDFAMRKLHPVLIPRRGIRVENEMGAPDELDRLVLEGADARFGTLEIEKNPNRASAFFLERPDHSGLAAHLILRGMAHIDAKEIGARMK